jgi:hypothetical protein
MTPRTRRLVLLVSAALGLTVGLWAAVGPRAFYDSFPGFGRTWIAGDGPFNEHLLRDVGALYLALAAASLASLRSRDTRAAGAAWTVFGVLHLGYHAAHLGGMAAVDVVGNVLALGLSLALGGALLLPDAAPARRGTPAGAR